MKLLRLYPEETEYIEIEWTRPMHYDNLLELDEDKQQYAFFYKIIAQYKDNEPKLLYIGHTYSQYVSGRLYNKDHQRKRLSLQKQFRNHLLKVSLGNLVLDRKVTTQIVKKVEAMLIYSHANEDYPFLNNTKGTWNHNISNEIHITNTGYRRDGMLKEIGVGIFFKH